MSFAEELKAEVEKVEAKIEDFFHHVGEDVSVEEKVVLEDAKTDAATLKAQIEAEAPEVEHEASDALKNGVSDLSSKVADVVENPSHLGEDVKEVEQEFVAQEEPAVKTEEQRVEADVKADEAQVETQAEGVVHDVEADLGNAPASNGVPAQPSQPVQSVVEPTAGQPVEHEDVKEEDTAEHQAAQAAEQLKREFAKAQQSVPEPPADQGAETPEAFVNRFPDNRNNVAGSVHQV